MTIKEARRAAGLTQKQVEELTGIPARSIQNWEAGVRRCPAYVEKMVINMIDQLDHERFLGILLEILKADVENVKVKETKEYIQNLIPTIVKQIHK